MQRLTKILSQRHNQTSCSNSNKEILINEKFEKNLQNWKLPVQSSVYKQKGTFEFSSDYVVKTVEEAIPLTEGYNSFQLLSKNLIEKHKENYKFLHVGMIQIGLKPATRLGLNTSAIICVRDKRHNKFHDSLLGIIESSLCDGPIYFSCLPNFTLSLNDPTLLHALCLDIKSDCFNMMQGLDNIILIYRIQYKVMNTVVPKMKIIPSDPIGSTTLFITNLAKSNLKVPKIITWDQVNLPENWVLERASEPVKQENRELDEIIEYPDGDVEIKFSNQRIARLNFGNQNKFDSGRCSTSSVPMSNLERDKISGIKFTSDGVNQPEY